MNVGLYDTPSRTSISSRPVSIDESRSGYVSIDLGVHELREGMYFWAATCDSKEAAGAVIVDRIVLVRDKAQGTRWSVQTNARE